MKKLGQKASEMIFELLALRVGKSKAKKLVAKARQELRHELRVKVK
jgi:uncharacterized protein YoaH (UPF0181 family)